MSTESVVENTVERIQPVDQAWIERAAERQLQLTKPPGSLGRLEEIANRMAGMQRTLEPAVTKPRIVVFAGDHGVCAEGVSPYPQIVTAQMVANYLRGGAAINVLARAARVDLEIVDVGVANAIPETSGLVHRTVALGTRNFCEGPAMTREEAAAAVGVGIERAACAVAEGSTLLGFGEMGIGNTTAAAALTAAMTGMAPEIVVGRGAGADDACLARKRSAVERALALHGAHCTDPLELLARLGGLEIAAMCGLCLGAAANRCAVLVDGFIATAAAAVAVRFAPAVRDYLFAAHRSTEPGQVALLEFIGQKPLLDLGMRLGEGTGSAMAVLLVRTAVAALKEMATFASAGVAEAGETA